MNTNLRAGQSVLDVAAGNGNATLAAARRFCKVLSTDYVPELLINGKERAQAEGFPVDFKVADAEDLTFENASFDNVMSTFGVMFAPNQAKVAQELSRVCKPGGKIGLVNWTPDSFIGELFKVMSSFITPPAGLNPPALWGTRAFIDDHFAESAKQIEFTEHTFSFVYQSAQHWLDVFRRFYGPTHKAFEALDTTKQQELAEEIFQLIDKHNQSEDNTMVVPSKYLEVVITLK